MTEDKILLHGLAGLSPFIPPRKLGELIKQRGNVESAWNTNAGTLDKLGWTAEQKNIFMEHRKNFNPPPASYWEKTGIKIISREDKDYPSLLLKIPDPPLALYLRGNAKTLNGLCIAFVGSRKATPYGKTSASALVRPLASKGLTIVSGLAYGIDAEAHHAALSVKGITVAVLGSGNDDAAIYPRIHCQLANKIIDSGGAVISEYPPGTSPLGRLFPQRNRIISGLSRAVVVVEAGKQSGALITAKQALDQNREVFAVPGPINSPLSAGTNSLIQEGAGLVKDYNDILNSLELQQLFTSLVTDSQQKEKRESQDSAEEQKILNLVAQNPLPIDDIAKLSTLPPHVVSATISLLEINGKVRDVGGRSYIRV